MAAEIMKHFIHFECQRMLQAFWVVLLLVFHVHLKKAQGMQSLCAQ